MSEKIFLTAKDGQKIAANFNEIDNPVGWVVLIHMMPANKESWDRLVSGLVKNNFSTIAIDLRGHGESEGGPTGYLNFDNAEHQKGILDLAAAVDFLKSKGAGYDKIIFVGASIGANLSLQFISEHRDFKKAILLSAGLNYRGVQTESLASKLQSDQVVFFISAKDDGRVEDNANGSSKLFNLVPSRVVKDLKIYETGGHGTEIIENHPELIDLIIKFIK